MNVLEDFKLETHCYGKWMTPLLASSADLTHIPNFPIDHIHCTEHPCIMTYIELYFHEEKLS